jgi:hypothetical protein
MLIPEWAQTPYGNGESPKGISPFPFEESPYMETRTVFFAILSVMQSWCITKTKLTEKLIPFHQRGVALKHIIVA